METEASLLAVAKSIYYFVGLSVLIYLIDHVYISLEFNLGMCFWAYSTQRLVFDIFFLAYGVKHFVSISSVTLFWQLYSPHTFHQRLGSLPEVVCGLTLGIQTRHSQSIRLHVHLNILETCYQRRISTY